MRTTHRATSKEIPFTFTRNNFYAKPSHLNAIGGCIAEAVTELYLHPTVIIGHREKGALLAHTTALHLSIRSAWTVENAVGFMLQPGYEMVIKGQPVMIVLHKDMEPRERKLMIDAIREIECTIIGSAVVTHDRVSVSVPDEGTALMI